jgi:RimJ/RimL family protein N-acetyltransferase
MQPAILETPRLAAVMWEPDDAGLIQEASFNDRDDPIPFPWSRENVARLVRRAGAPDGTTKYKILIRERPFHWPRGLSQFGGERQDFELGYSLRQQDGCKGYATDIANGLADWFFRRKFAQQFIAFTHPGPYSIPACPDESACGARMPMIIDGLACPTFELTAGIRSA